jgi:hypothetical protein
MANYVWGCAWKWRKGVFGGDASLHSTPLNAKNPAARIHFSNESVLNLVVKKQAETPPPPQVLLEREDFFETTMELIYLFSI